MLFIEDSTSVNVGSCSLHPSSSTKFNSTSTSTTLFCQIPAYLSTNALHKKRLLKVNRSNLKEIKQLMKTVISLSGKLVNMNTVENYRQLNEKHLFSVLFTIVKII